MMRRDLGKRPSLLVKTILFCLVIYNLYAFTSGGYDIFEHMVINLMFILPAGFITYSPSKNAVNKVGWYDYLLALTSFIVGFVFWMNYYSWLFNRMWLVSPLSREQVVFGVALVILLLELTRRCYGWILFGLTSVFLIYGVLCPYLPYPFGFRTTVERVLDLLAFTPYGIFSTPLQTMVTYVVAFTILGASFQMAGVSDFFMNFSKALVGRSIGGVAKVAVIGSALFGSISGSAVANVYATGTFTIPTMIGLGYPREFAAAVEAVASTGGQITPPVLGSSAFVMAEILQIPYATIVIASAIPAIIYYTSLYVQVHYNSLKLGLRGLPKEETPSLGEVMRRQGHCLIPIIVLVYFLIVVKWSPITSALASFYTSLALSLLRRDVRRAPLSIPDKLVEGGKEIISIIIAACAAGIIVGILTYTGITLKFGYLVMSASFGIRELALLYTALLTILLGFGLPTTAAYIMASAVAIPALSLLGIKGLVAHMFIFHFATRSSLTPPVALAAYAAANIAKASPMRVGLEAVKLGIITFIIPFIFVFKPELLLVVKETSVMSLAWLILTAIIAASSISVGIAGYMKGRIPATQRAVFIVGGFILLYSSSIVVDAALMTAILLLVIYHRVRAAPRDVRAERAGERSS